MMKAWKDELKVGNEDEDPSAINGETEGVNGPSSEVPEEDAETIYELDAPRDNGSRRVSLIRGQYLVLLLTNVCQCYVSGCEDLTLVALSLLIVIR